MILLDVKEYCQSCTEFEPEVEKPTNFYANFEKYMSVGDTVIRCEHRNRCEKIINHLKGENT